MANFTQQEITRLQAYMQTTFNNPNIYLKARKNGDSVEVDINGEFIGTIYKDEEDGETSYDFNMAILDIDLPGSKAA
ncbi:MAG: DUF3126 family protein [Alphaproteobacteria bacterium PRO2]|nr:DUF3126 family protein [Alphaproteobacteria bacterium PRO2]